MKHEFAAINGNEIVFSDQYLSFFINEYQYGLNIVKIREVIEYNQISQISKVPMINESIFGIINLRGDVVPVIDTGMRICGIGEKLTDKTSILIIEKKDEDEEVVIGLMVDEVEGIANISESDVTVKPDFGLNIRSEFIDRVANYNDKFIILLNIDEIIDSEDLSEISADEADLDNIESMRTADGNGEFSFTDKYAQQENSGNVISGEQDFIILNIDEEKYCINVRNIREIIREVEISAIPNSLPFMKGIINLRGILIPVVDMRERCGLNKIAYSADAAVIIIYYKESLVGLYVDEISSIVKANPDNIQHPERYSAKMNSDFIEGLFESDHQVIILIDINKILTPEEHDLLHNEDFNNRS